MAPITASVDSTNPPSAPTQADLFTSWISQFTHTASDPRPRSANSEGPRLIVLMTERTERNVRCLSGSGSASVLRFQPSQASVVFRAPDVWIPRPAAGHSKLRRPYTTGGPACRLSAE